VTGKGRDRRAAKQRRRDERRGFRAGTGTDAGADRGLPPETLRRVLRETAADLAAGHEGALGELRLLLTEHLARRRGEILTACDEVLTEAGTPGEGTRAWAEREGRSTEEAVVATVRRLASLT
jgi:hypothetical protein